MTGKDYTVIQREEGEAAGADVYLCAETPGLSLSLTYFLSLPASNCLLLDKHLPCSRQVGPGSPWLAGWDISLGGEKNSQRTGQPGVGPSLNQPWTSHVVNGMGRISGRHELCICISIWTWSNGHFPRGKGEVGHGVERDWVLYSLECGGKTGFRGLLSAKLLLHLFTTIAGCCSKCLSMWHLWSFHHLSFSHFLKITLARNCKPKPFKHDLAFSQTMLTITVCENKSSVPTYAMSSPTSPCTCIY